MKPIYRAFGRAERMGVRYVGMGDLSRAVPSTPALGKELARRQAARALPSSGISAGCTPLSANRLC
jgi:hypothetical protein